MTIQLNMNSLTLHEDLKVLVQVMACDSESMIKGLQGFLKISNISLVPYVDNNIVINVSLEEFVNIGLFNGGL
jgi:hypothetical protein